MLPGVNGWDICRRIRKAGVGCHIWLYPNDREKTAEPRKRGLIPEEYVK